MYEQTCPCGWLKDRFGISWQIVLAMLSEWLTDTDPERWVRVMATLIDMKKLDIGVLKQTY